MKAPSHWHTDNDHTLLYNKLVHLIEKLGVAWGRIQGYKKKTFLKQ